MYREEMASNTFETIEVTRSAGVVSITLNRPERKNAINQVMWNELLANFHEIGHLFLQGGI